MAKNVENTDQIRQLTNRVHLAGALAELEVAEGTTKVTNIPYISLRGAIQCGESAVDTVNFRSFIKSRKQDGTDSKNYTTVKEWVKKAVPMTKDKDNPTYVDMIGSLSDNPFVTRDGNLVEGVNFNTQLFSDFTEYAADIDIEGFIHSVIDEVKNDEPTGRKKMRIVTRDIFNNTLDLKNIIIPSDLVDDVEDGGYESGATATIFVTLMPNKGEAAPKKAGGIGKQRVTEGRTYLEWIMVGADPVIDSDSDKALDVKVIKKAMNERKNHLDEIKEAGYQGSSDGSSASAGSSGSSSGRTGIAGKAKKSETKGAPAKKGEFAEVEDDEEFPF